MADQVDDPNVITLNQSITDAQTAFDKAKREFDGAEKRRKELAARLAMEFWGVSDNSWKKAIEKYEEENDHLIQAVQLAQDRNPAATSIAKSIDAMVDVPQNLDRMVLAWLGSFKTEGQKSFEEFVFGNEVGRPPKIKIYDVHEAIFLTYEWENMVRELKKESAERERIIYSLNEAVFAVAAEYGKEQILPSGPTPLQLQELQRQLDDSKKLLKGYQKQLAYVQGFSQGRWTEEEMRREAMVLALEEQEKEKKEQEQLQQQRVAPVAGQPVNLLATATGQPAHTPAKQRPHWQPTGGPETLMAAPAGGPETLTAPEYLGQPWSLREIARHPFKWSEEKVGQAKKWFSGLFAKKEAAKVAEKTGEAAVKAGAGAVAKKVAPALVAKLAGFIPTGVTQVLAIASIIKDLLSSKTIRKILAYAAFGVGYGISLALGLIFHSVWTVAGAAIGGFIGFFTPLTPIGGALAGAGLMYMAEGAISGALSAIGGALSGAGTAATAAVTTTTTAIGGFLVTTTSVAGTAAAITTALASGSAAVLIAVVSIGVLSIVSDTTRNSIFAQAPQQEAIQTTQGGLFTLTKVAAKETAVVGDKIDYLIYVTALDNDIQVTGVADSLATVSFQPTTVTKNQSKTFSYSYTVKQTDDNKTLTNTATVTVKSGDRTETLTASARVQIGTTTQNACPVALAGTPCDPERMKPLFGTNADNASRICVKESDPRHVTWGNEKAINDSCANPNLTDDKRREYSVGLFQVNLWAHWQLCTQVLNGQNPFRKPFKSGCTYPNCTPCDRDETLLAQCKDYWIKPENNIRYAAELSKGGTDWYPNWSTAGPAYCNIP